MLFRGINAKLDQITSLLQQLIQQGKVAMTTLADIQAKLAAQTTAIQNNNALLAQLSTLIRQNINDPTALAQIADTIDANTASISAADAANTPPTTTP